MNLEQLKAIGTIDQLKAKKLMTQEEYDATRARILAMPDNPRAALPLKSAPQPTKGANVFAIFILIIILISAGLFIKGCMNSNKPLTEEEKQHERENEELEKELNAMKSLPEQPFNPDLLQSTYMLTVVNRNSIAYKNCELTINDRFKAKVPKVDPSDTYIVANQKLADDEGNIYNPNSIQIQEIEFYCKDYNGHSDIVSLEKK